MDSNSIKGVLAVVPSYAGIMEPFSLKLKLLGDIREIPCTGGYGRESRHLNSPFNVNVARNIRFMDNCLPEWKGKIIIDGGDDLEGPSEIIFDGYNQGVTEADTRPIKKITGLKWKTPGFKFIRLIEPSSGMIFYTNPMYITEKTPNYYLYWGDIHWQTFFSDGIRCPEQLYSFARDEAFLDFGAISDHMEAISDTQWEYFKLVTNKYNNPGSFVTLLGQEWTHHDTEFGAPGHRNIYFRGNDGPVLRSTDKDCNTLEKLWKKLDSLKDVQSVAIPHHSANVIMGVKWELGWNQKYEKSVEIYSCWGSSEMSAEKGNTRPIQHCNGECSGRHVIDALKMGYKMGFVAGGDIHDGRPGDDLQLESYWDIHDDSLYPQGFIALRADSLSREKIFDAICTHKTYATTKKRIFLDWDVKNNGNNTAISVKTATEDKLKAVEIIMNGERFKTLHPEYDERIVEGEIDLQWTSSDDFCYIKVITASDEMAWGSPVFAK